MKLVLANNQSDRFVNFYKELREQSHDAFEYAPYDQLLFTFDSDAELTTQVKHLGTGRNLQAYDGVYLNGYLSTYELAATTAICCQALGLPFVNKELTDSPSLSKLTGYAKLAYKGVRIPRTIAGTKNALRLATEDIAHMSFPAVLKRADADRGIDNYKIHEAQEIESLLASHDERSLWILQAYVPNNGFYLVSFYDQQPVFSIFRTLEQRPDGNEQKAHMYKPIGGKNATLVNIADVPPTVLNASRAAMTAMNRQIGSVDLLYDPASDKAHVLEVNYNPQLVTIETFKDIRVQAFLDGLKKID